MSINQLININSINNNKKMLKIKANDEDLLFLANENSVLKFLNLEATIEIIRNFSRFIVKGSIEADITQEDAITLEEINSHLSLPVKRIFEKEAKSANSKKIKNVLVLLDKEEEVDSLENDTIDLKSIILEELILNINPFLKKEN